MQNMTHTEFAAWVQRGSGNLHMTKSLHQAFVLTKTFKTQGLDAVEMFAGAKTIASAFTCPGKIVSLHCRFQPLMSCATEGFRANLGIFRDGGFALRKHPHRPWFQLWLGVDASAVQERYSLAQEIAMF